MKRPYNNSVDQFLNELKGTIWHGIWWVGFFTIVLTFVGLLRAWGFYV